MPIYQYRIRIPEVPKEQCPLCELLHSANESLQIDPQTGYPLERVYTAPNLSKGYSEGHTKSLLTNENIAKHGFTKYVRDPIAQRYVREAGIIGPESFSVK